MIDSDICIVNTALPPCQRMLGLHWLIDLSGCSPSILANLERVESIMRGAANKANATVVNTMFHNFTPHGISGFVVISESHLAIHTWPEHSYAAVDIFTCGHRGKMLLAYEYIVKEFSPTEHSKIEIPRKVGPGYANREMG